jgi:hypothetical protein
VANLKKKWPERDDLISWWVYHKIQTSTVEEFDDPEAIRQWFIEFGRLSMRGVFLELYSVYPDFRLLHVNPHYLDNGNR